MMQTDFPYSYSFDVTRLGNKIERLTLQPDADALKRMVEVYGLIRLEDLACQMELRPYRKSGIAVVGHLTAVAVQPCGVTLEPVEQRMDEQFERRFDPSVETETSEEEIEIDAMADDPPDPMEGRYVDLGAVLCEHFALSLEPFPRAPGAEVPEEHQAEASTAEDTETEARPSPFAVLSQLRGNNDDTESR